MAADGGNDGTHLPLQGVVICCTSLTQEERASIHDPLIEMGAEHKLDLTSDVTHLIVGELQTPKYKFVAREREDVACLAIDWVFAVREQFLSGGDVALEDLEQRYKLPTFWSLEICITGFEDTDQRKEIETQIVQHGGQYRGDLRKDCTHLVCFSPVGAKYSSAKAWGIHTVSIEWLTMSIQRGLILDEEYFKPTMLPEERGRGAWLRKPLTRVESLKRGHGDGQFGRARKLRRTASERFSSDNVWGDIVSAAPSPALEPSESFATAARFETESESEQHERASEIAAKRKLSRSQSLRSNHNIGAIGGEVATLPSANRAGIFFGKSFLIHGFDSRRVKLLEQHLQAHDAQVFNEPGLFQQSSASSAPNSSFTIVPYTSSPEELSSSPSISEEKCVTELWLEKCLHEKRCVAPASRAHYTPFKHPMAGFEKLTVTCTGIEGVDLLHLSRVVELLGAKFSESLNPETSVLLCNDSSLSREKVRCAIQWNVPAVDSRWLWECIRQGSIRPFQEFMIHPQLQQARERRTSDDTKAPSDIAPKPAQNKKLLGRSFNAPPAPRPPDLVVRDSFASRSDGPLNDDDSNIPNRQAPSGTRWASESLPVSEPLHEVSPNLPRLPSIPPSPSKQSNAAPALSQTQQTKDDLAVALTSLLTRAREQKTPASPSHRTRRLLGRARSDLSTRSLGSHAGSVDSMNTDGVGTPLEPAFKYSPSKPKATAAAPQLHARRSSSSSKLAATSGIEDVSGSGKSQAHESLTAELLRSHEDIEKEEEERRRAEDSTTPVMTQVGYDDSEASKWRERLARKMAGAGANEPPSPEVERELESARIRRQLQDEGGQNISARTRHKRG